MLIELGELFKKDNFSKELDLDIDYDEYDSGFDSFKIKQKSLLHIKIFHLKNKHISVNGNISLKMDIPCDRCLEEVEQDFDISFSKEFDLEKEVLDDENENETEEAKFITKDYKLDVNKIIDDELMIAWPSKVLCREDCKGLCVVCGHNLNAGDCGCNRVVLDPRMAVIQDIFKNSGN